MREAMPGRRSSTRAKRAGSPRAMRTRTSWPATCTASAAMRPPRSRPTGRPSPRTPATPVRETRWADLLWEGGAVDGGAARVRNEPPRPPRQPEGRARVRPCCCRRSTRAAITSCAPASGYRQGLEALSGRAGDFASKSEPARRSPPSGGPTSTSPTRAATTASCSRATATSSIACWRRPRRGSSSRRPRRSRGGSRLRVGLPRATSSSTARRAATSRAGSAASTRAIRDLRLLHEPAGSPTTRARIAAARRALPPPPGRPRARGREAGPGGRPRRARLSRTRHACRTPSRSRLAAARARAVRGLGTSRRPRACRRSTGSSPATRWSPRARRRTTASASRCLPGLGTRYARPRARARRDARRVRPARRTGTLYLVPAVALQDPPGQRRAHRGRARRAIREGLLVIFARPRPAAHRGASATRWRRRFAARGLATASAHLSSCPT